MAALIKPNHLRNNQRAPKEKKGTKTGDAAAICPGFGVSFQNITKSPQNGKAGKMGKKGRGRVEKKMSKVGRNSCPLSSRESPTASKRKIESASPSGWNVKCCKYVLSGDVGRIQTISCECVVVLFREETRRRIKRTRRRKRNVSKGPSGLVVAISQPCKYVPLLDPSTKRRQEVNKLECTCILGSYLGK